MLFDIIMLILAISGFRYISIFSEKRDAFRCADDGFIREMVPVAALSKMPRFTSHGSLRRRSFSASLSFIASILRRHAALQLLCALPISLLREIADDAHHIGVRR